MTAVSIWTYPIFFRSELLHFHFLLEHIYYCFLFEHPDCHSCLNLPWLYPDYYLLFELTLTIISCLNLPCLYPDYYFLFELTPTIISCLNLPQLSFLVWTYPVYTQTIIFLFGLTPTIISYLNLPWLSFPVWNLPSLSFLVWTYPPTIISCLNLPWLSFHVWNLPQLSFPVWTYPNYHFLFELTLAIVSCLNLPWLSFPVWTYPDYHFLFELTLAIVSSACRSFSFHFFSSVSTTCSKLCNFLSWNRHSIMKQTGKCTHSANDSLQNKTKNYSKNNLTPPPPTSGIKNVAVIFLDMLTPVCVGHGKHGVHIDWGDTVNRCKVV